MNIKHISFEDLAYLDTITKIGRKNLESLERMFNRHGPRRFQAAFLDTYKKVCIEDDGRLDNKKICDKFMCKMRERVREYSKESSLKVLSNTAEHVINRIGGTYAEEINDLLQQILTFLLPPISIACRQMYPTKRMFLKCSRYVKVMLNFLFF